MTASVDVLGGIHQALAGVYRQILDGREEPVIVGGEVLMKDGEPVMRKIPPSAAELAAINTFLKSNNITAVVGNDGKLAELQKLMDERRKGRTAPRVRPPEFPDAHAVMPNPDTPWQ